MYLITGGGGFIGSHIARALVQRGDRVRVLDNESSGSRTRLGDALADVEWIDGDICDAETLKRVMQGVEIVFHQAAVASVQRSIAEPDMTHAVNLTGTLNVLEVARHAGVRRVVFASSSAVYGMLPDSPKSESMATQPLSPYAAHKAASEHYCQVWHRLNWLETVALRYFNVFGPQQDPNSEYAAVIPKFITAVLSGREPTIFGDGEQSRDFIYIDDVVAANLRAAQQPDASGQIFNVGTGISVTLNQLIGHLSNIIGREIHPCYEASRPGDIRESVADISRLKTVLGYQPVVPFSAGLERTVTAFAAPGSF